MGMVLGIDCGTTNSCMAVWRGQRAVVIPDAEGGRLTPAVAAVTPDGEQLAGQPARHWAVAHPADAAFSLRRLLGLSAAEAAGLTRCGNALIETGADGGTRLRLGDRTFSPLELFSRILGKLKTDAEIFLGEPIREAVLTVPVAAPSDQRQAVQEAARLAGLTALRLVDESTAVALAYEPRLTTERRLAVVTVGGGSVNVSLIERQAGELTVTASRGEAGLGGDDLDRAICGWLAGVFRETAGFDLPQDSRALRLLREAAERAKCELSSATQTRIVLPFLGDDRLGHLDLILSRARLEQWADSWLERILDLVQTALDDAHLSGADIDAILLAGGQTRMPALRDRIARLFGRSPLALLPPDEAAALGAARLGGILTGAARSSRLNEVTPLPLGIETQGGVATVLIPRHTRIPARVRQVFSTAVDNQNTVSIRVLQGERPMADDNRTLGRFELAGIPPAPRGFPQIEVVFDIDSNGIVLVSARDLGTGQIQHITLTAGSGLNEQDIARMITESREYADTDRRRRREVDIVNRAEALAYHTDIVLQEHGGKADSQTRDQVRKAVEDLRRIVAGGEPDLIEAACHKVERMARKLGESIYQQATARREEADRSRRSSSPPGGDPS